MTATNSGPVEQSWGGAAGLGLSRLELGLSRLELGLGLGPGLRLGVADGPAPAVVSRLASDGAMSRAMQSANLASWDLIVTSLTTRSTNHK